jgi:hypothetical protein
MSTSTQADGRDRIPASELRRMDEQTARNTLTVNQFERWEKLRDLHERADEQRAEWQEDARVATETLVFADASDLAAEVSVFGNDLAVYYAADDPRIRDAAEDLAAVLDVDPDAPPEEIDAINAADIDAEDLDAVTDALAELVCLAVVAWNGTAWDEFTPAEREHIRHTITSDPPTGWGIAGLMDAWTVIQTAVEEQRDDRLERVRKFRNPERRGDR